MSENIWLSLILIILGKSYTIIKRDISDDEPRRIETEFAKSRYMLKSIREDETLLSLFNSFKSLEVKV